MLFLALAVACSLSIGMIFKYTGRRGMDQVALLTVNYVVAAVVGVFMLQQEGSTLAGMPAGLWGLGIFTGVLFIFGFFLLSLTTLEVGMGLAIGVMRVSVVVPFLASWLIWGEVPTPLQFVGIALAGAAFFMIARTHRADIPSHEGMPLDAPEAEDKPVSSARAFGLLALLFAAGGMVDVSLKTYKEVFAAEGSQAQFFFLIFIVAFLSGLVFVVRKGAKEGVWPTRAEIVWGIGLGVVNYLSVEFLMRAVKVLPGTIVFPANSIAIVVAGALLGVFVWREHLSRLNWTGIAVAAAALALLST